MKTYSIKEHSIPIYTFKVIYVEYNPEYFEKCLATIERRYNFDVSSYKPLKNCHGFAGMGPEGFRLFLVFINDKKNRNSARYINTVTHEIRHLVDDVCIYFELIAVKNKANEHIAYLTGYLNEKIINRRRLK